MRPLIFTILFLCSSTYAQAYVPVLVTQESLIDITPITDPELEQVFFGELTGFPHTYEIEAKTPFTLVIGVHTPDLETNTNTASGIVIKETTRGRVEEITRLTGTEASWNVVRDTLSGGRYREGLSFESQLDPGVYRIEIHTPDNREKYQFAIGTREEMTIGYIELLRRIISVDKFLERSVFWIITSPYVYWPLFGLVSVCMSAWYLRRRFSRIGDVRE